MTTITAAAEMYVRTNLTAYTRAVEIPTGENAVSVSAVATSLFSGGVTVDLEEGDDLQNWIPAAGGSSLSLDASKRQAFGAWTGVASRYVRAKVVSTGGAFVSIDVVTSSQ